MFETDLLRLTALEPEQLQPNRSLEKVKRKVHILDPCLLAGEEILMAERAFGGPYVQVAAICTTPLVEQQGYLSVIRIQDRFQLAGTTDQMQPQALSALCLLISLKSGEMRGKANITVTPITPGGKELASVVFPVLFEGEERGNVFAFPLAIVAEEEGLYWFEVKLEGALLTRVPLRVMYQKLQMIPGMPFQPPRND